MEFAVSQLKEQIQRNCDISDANYAGLYSLCSLLLRMRDLYKWEHDLCPWEEPEPSVLLDWVDARENRWEEIARDEIRPLTLGIQSYDPFNMAELNSELRPLGLVYGAGYVLGMKPSFFLGQVIESRTLGDLQVDIVDRELARDIYMTPAMRQGHQIFARQSPMLFFLWDQILEQRPSARAALRYAFEQYNLDPEAMLRSPKALAPQLQQVARQEIETWIYHEVGEVHESGFNGQMWHEIVSAYSNSPVEIFARAVKDLLADTHLEGLLGHIIRNRIHSSLGFYTAFLRPFTRVLFPEIIAAFQRFKLSGDWSVIEEARSSGHERAKSCARQLVEMHQAGRKQSTSRTISQIRSRLIEPYGL